MAAAAAAEPPSGNPAWPDSRQTAYLGVHIDAVTPQQASALKLANPSGAVITDLDRDSPACKAGLKENDCHRRSKRFEDRIPGTIWGTRST